jgi:predicted DNA-binding transcriptional regulator AlpA
MVKWLNAEQVAAKLGGMSVRYGREKFCTLNGFPAAMRPEGGRPLWREDEVDAWCESKRERQPSRAATSLMSG